MPLTRSSIARLEEEQRGTKRQRLDEEGTYSESVGEESDATSEEASDETSTPDAVLEYAHSSIAIKEASAAYSAFRKERNEHKNAKQEVLVSGMMECGAKSRRVSVDGKDFVLSLQTRYSTSKFNDDALHRGLVDVFIADDDDEEAEDEIDMESLSNTVLDLPSDEDGIRTMAAQLCKAIQRARTTRSTAIKMKPATETTRTSEHIESDMLNDAQDFIRTLQSLDRAKTHAEKHIKPMREKLERAESNILNTIERTHEFTVEFEDGRRKKVKVGPRNNAVRTPKPKVPRLKVQMIKGAIEDAVSSLVEGAEDVTMEALFSRIKVKIAEATRPVEVDDDASTASTYKERSLVMRMINEEESIDEEE